MLSPWFVSSMSTWINKQQTLLLQAKDATVEQNSNRQCLVLTLETAVVLTVEANIFRSAVWHFGQLWLLVSTDFQITICIFFSPFGYTWRWSVYWMKLSFKCADVFRIVCCLFYCASYAYFEWSTLETLSEILWNMLVIGPFPFDTFKL